MVSADIMLAVIATSLHCYRDQPATYHPATEPQKSESHEFVRLLWNEGETLRNRIFTTKSVSVPTFLPDGNQD